MIGQTNKTSTTNKNTQTHNNNVDFFFLVFIYLCVLWCSIYIIILLDSYCILAFVSISMCYIICYFNLNSIPIKFLF